MIYALAWIAALGVGGELLVRRSDPDCGTVSRTSSPAAAAAACEREYLRTQDPTTGVLLAEAQLGAGDRAAASALANGLLATPARGDALRVIGEIAASEHRPEAALSAFERAREIHRSQARRAALAADDQAIAETQRSLSRLAPALRAADECVAEAGGAKLPSVEARCRVSAAHALAAAGWFEAALRELARAAPAFTSDRELAWLAAQYTELDQDRRRGPAQGGGDPRAIARLEDAVHVADRARLPELAAGAELELAAALARAERLGDADRRLAAIRLDRAPALDGPRDRARAGIEAELAYRRGDLALAAAYLDQLYPTLRDDDERIAACAMRARVALAARDLAGAERWAVRGVELAERLRAASAVELRPWVRDARRAPYELWFAALARAGRVEDALAVLDRWEARALRDLLARPEPAMPLDLGDAASRIEKITGWLPVLASAPLVSSDPSPAAISALRRTDFLALVVADRELWRATSSAGRLHLVDLGRFAELADRIERFTAAPTDRALADELGRLLLDDATARATTGALRVVLDGPLAALPVAALRRGGRALIAARPIVRSPRLSAPACAAPPPGPRRAIALADPAGDLPEARREAQDAAALFGATSLVGSAATSPELLAAGPEDLLHLAVRARDAGGSSLALHDRTIQALEIAARARGPALVVLAIRGAPGDRDPGRDLTGVLAAAFLAAGSAQVVATLRPLSDAAARGLTSRFYRDGGAGDPVRVLADIQAQLAATGDTDWPSLAVFGRDVCVAGRSR